MFTTQTTHHRFQFINITDSVGLVHLASALGLEPGDEPGQYDLVLEEGYSLTLDEAVRQAYPIDRCEGYDNGLEVEEAELFELLSSIAQLHDFSNPDTYQPQTDLLHEYYHSDEMIERDISCIELMDLIMLVASGFELQSIYTQWAMHSSKAQFGAHAGGTRLTTQLFSVPCDLAAVELEKFLPGLSTKPMRELGVEYVDKFVAPMVSRLPEGTFKEMVKLAMAERYSLKG